MDLSKLIDYILHLDKYMIYMINSFGNWSYVIIFLIIFCETGLVIMPFLPGDSLIFTVGALAAIDLFNIWVLFFLLCFAAVAGDSLNYWIGGYLGAKAIKRYPNIFKKEYIRKTKEFYKQYGSKTIIIARFLPVVRTFAPFFAGVGKMSYGKFLFYNIIGGIIWVSIFLFLGYFFGNVSYVKDHFGAFIGVIILISFVPVVWELVSRKIASMKKK